MKSHFFKSLSLGLVLIGSIFLMSTADAGLATVQCNGGPIQVNIPANARPKYAVCPDGKKAPIIKQEAGSRSQSQAEKPAGNSNEQ